MLLHRIPEPFGDPDPGLLQELGRQFTPGKDVDLVVGEGDFTAIRQFHDYLVFFYSDQVAFEFDL